MKALLREPLVHFLLIGVLLFAVSSQMAPSGGEAPGEIIITRGQVENLASGFDRTWRRPPTAEELEGLVRERVQEEVYYREALALGLDQDDVIIRRRLRQKLEFVSEDLSAAGEPSEADLQAFLSANAARFSAEPRLTFRQVYLDPARRGDSLARDTERLLARLAAEGAAADIATQGDPIQLEPDYRDIPSREVASLFGEPFAKALDGLETARWQGPVPSGYGAHLVFVSSREPGKPRPLAEVRDQVRREWEEARRAESSARIYEALLARYTVTVEPPPYGAGAPGAAPAGQ